MFFLLHFLHDIMVNKYVKQKLQRQVLYKNQ